MTEPNALGQYYQLINRCRRCNSGLTSSFYKNERQEDVRACDKCRPEILCQIFDYKYLDLFEYWRDNCLADDTIGWEWAWDDLLKEKKCIRIKSLEEARQKQTEDHILIQDPDNEEAHILVPKEYAEAVLKNGKMV